VYTLNIFPISKESSNGNKGVKMKPEYRNYGEVDFQDHELEEREEQYEKDREEIEK